MALVLGAGNQGFLTMCDVLYMMFVEGHMPNPDPNPDPNPNPEPNPDCRLCRGSQAQPRPCLQSQVVRIFVCPSYQRR